MTTINKAAALMQSNGETKVQGPAALVAQAVDDTGAFVIEYNERQDDFVLFLSTATGADGTLPVDLSFVFPASIFRDFLSARPVVLNS